MKRTLYYREGYKYVVDRDFAVQTQIKGSAARSQFIRLDQDGLLTILAGYAWDGASGPTFDSKSSLRASLVHDALYQLMREGHLGQEWRQAADELFAMLLELDGMWKIRRWAWFKAVRDFAAAHAKRQNRKVLSAP